MMHIRNDDEDELGRGELRRRRCKSIPKGDAHTAAAAADGEQTYARFCVICVQNAAAATDRLQQMIEGKARAEKLRAPCFIS